ncbi:DUF1573 domain-containing protein [Rubinisphaera margarita]|uniref:DUF1573 domain-containing protein n=1 Tax=Rubinisphaera margarita TaxID=2909586 RepID=UPI001EE94FF7|nr:DUF1573 domain-containing protein [Rubinisphaera margarita]MCG6155522.1 DUF1573 domain-containing protein [Rubinisphaera margarita]
MRSAAICLLALTPCLASAWSAARAVDSRFIPEAAVAPLAMHIHMVHLREVDLREGKAVAEFGFHNAGEQSLTITAVKPSCGCVTIRMHENREFKPDEHGKFYVEVDTAGEQAGLQEYTVDVAYRTAGSTAEEHKHVTFRVDVPEKKVTVKPRALIFYQLSAQKTTQTVTITDFRSLGTLEVLDVRCELGQLSIENRRVEQDVHGNPQVKFDVAITGIAPAGRQTDVIIVTTNDPEFPEIKVPLLVNGPMEK